MIKLSHFAGAAFALLLTIGGGANALVQPLGEFTVASDLTGRCLVASRQMTDRNFARTVIYLLGHSREGAMGVIINRLLGPVSFRKLLAPLGIKTRSARDVDLYLGGPVEIGRGLILHSPDYTGAGTQQLGESIAVSTGSDVLVALAEGKGPKRARVMLGYAGWGAGQLDREMARGDWLVAPADPSLIFSTEPEKIWDKAMLQAGISL